MFLVTRKPFGIYEQTTEKKFPRLHLSQNIKSRVVGFLTKIDFKSLQQLECETDSVVSHSGTFKERVHKKSNISVILNKQRNCTDSQCLYSIHGEIRILFFGWKICIFERFVCLKTTLVSSVSERERSLLVNNENVTDE